MKDDLIVCRCEEVSLREIKEAIANGAETSRQLKLATRAGMGFCQGRTCRTLIEAVAGAAASAPPEGAPSLMSHKPPARPVTFGVLAGEEQK